MSDEHLKDIDFDGDGAETFEQTRKENEKYFDKNQFPEAIKLAQPFEPKTLDDLFDRWDLLLELRKTIDKLDIGYSTIKIIDDEISRVLQKIKTSMLENEIVVLRKGKYFRWNNDDNWSRNRLEQIQITDPKTVKLK